MVRILERSKSFIHITLQSTKNTKYYVQPDFCTSNLQDKYTTIRPFQGLYPASAKLPLSASNAFSTSPRFGSVTLTPMCPNLIYLAAISLCSPPANITPFFNKFGSISGALMPSGKYIAVMPLAWFSGFEASCLRPMDVMVSLMRRELS